MILPKNRLNRELGFTMTEIIVVLVIIAVLAAMAIPALMGYVKDAKEKASLSLARNTFAQLNGVLLEADKTPKSQYSEIIKYFNTNGGNQRITYMGPTDNSATGADPGAYHNHAKNAIRDMMGGKTIPFGYRIDLTLESGTYRIKRMEVFYVTPANAGITGEKPDIVFGE